MPVRTFIASWLFMVAFRVPFKVVVEVARAPDKRLSLAVQGQDALLHICKAFRYLFIKNWSFISIIMSVSIFSLILLFFFHSLLVSNNKSY